MDCCLRAWQDQLCPVGISVVFLLLSRISATNVEIGGEQLHHGSDLEDLICILEGCVLEKWLIEHMGSVLEMPYKSLCGM